MDSRSMNGLSRRSVSTPRLVTSPRVWRKSLCDVDDVYPLVYGDDVESMIDNGIPGTIRPIRASILSAQLRCSEY